MSSPVRKRRRGRKLLYSLAALGAAASIAGMATYATFTSSVSQSQTISSGTVSLNLGATGSAINRLNIGASNIAPGDTMQRSVDLINGGTINMASITLTNAATTSSALDTDAVNGLQLTIDKCSQAWTEGGTAPAYTYTCGGTTSSVVASRPVIGSNISMSNVSDLLTSGTTDHLLMTLTLPTGAGNSMQNLSSTLTYTFTGTQRAGTDK